MLIYHIHILLTMHGELRSHLAKVLVHTLVSQHVTVDPEQAG